MPPKRKEAVTNYYIRFDSGKMWQLPRDLYSWSEEFNMSPVYVCQNAHRGDRFITVTNKKSGEIDVAYDTNFLNISKNRDSKKLVQSFLLSHCFLQIFTKVNIS